MSADEGSGGDRVGMASAAQPPASVTPGHERWSARGVRWLMRYGPAELLAIIASYAGYFGTLSAGGGPLVAAWVAALTENIGFYAIMVGRDLAAAPRGQRVRALMHLGAEFGPAECLDSLLIRPVTVAGAAALVGPGYGVLLGKLAADGVFYALAILSHERLRDRRAEVGAAP